MWYGGYLCKTVLVTDDTFATIDTARRGEGDFYVSKVAMLLLKKANEIDEVCRFC